MGLFRRKRKVGECRIKDANFIPLVKGEINGKSFYFVVDTGASISVIDKASLKRYLPNVKIRWSADVNVAGYGGSVNKLERIFINVKSGNLTFNDYWFTKDISNVIQSAEIRTGKRVIGIIGNPNLNDKVVDLANKRIYYPDN